MCNGVEIDTVPKANNSSHIEVIDDISRVKNIYLDLLNRATREINLLIPTSNGLKRLSMLGGLRILKEKCTNQNVKVRILSPLKANPLANGANTMLAELVILGKRRNFQIRPIEQMSDQQQRSTIVVVDRKFSLILELKDDTKDNFVDAIGPSIYSHSVSSVSSYTTIFENLWHQSELYEQIVHANRELEEKSQQIILKDKELQGLIFKLLEEDKSKDEFMSMVSHELKTPISVIKFYADMLLRINIMGAMNEQQKKALSTIHRNVEKLELLVNDILDVYRLDIGKMNISKESVDIAELVNQTISDLKSLLDEKDVKVETEFRDRQSLHCDAKRIAQVLSNLIKNSIDFVPREKGRIIIKTEYYDAAKQKHEMSENVSNPDEKMLLFSIEDNGPGIPIDKIGNIFKKFYQIDTSLTRKHGGTGLGLAICKGIVEAHGGFIWIDNSAAEGTLVKFTLPANSTGIKE
jgi:signal transduction histidine kinase